MGDIKRINRIISLIMQIWVKHPDLRLGQLLVNALGTDDNLFYIEDIELEKALEGFIVSQYKKEVEPTFDMNVNLE